ncbi:MAG: hypothetical protein O9324_13880, partial [Microcystis sp. LE19-84.1B]|nr:hypothetical protein [Microcystis sp. LE19-84.1B]
SYQLSVISYQLSVISYQLSVISYQLSVISYQLSVISYQLSVISYQGASRLCVIIFAYGIVKCLSGKTFRAILRIFYQYRPRFHTETRRALSVISYQLSVISYQLSVH